MTPIKRYCLSIVLCSGVAAPSITHLMPSYTSAEPSQLGFGLTMRKAIVQQDTASTAKGSARGLALFNNGQRLRGEWKEESFQAAIMEYKSAITVFRTDRDKAGEARAVLSIGEVLAILGEHESALKQYRLALRLAATLTDSNLEIDILNRVAEIEIERRAPGHEARAKSALDIAEQTGYSAGAAQALLNLGIIAYIQRKAEAAIEYFDRSLLLFTKEADLGGQADALLNLGLTYGDFGQTNKAALYFDQAVALARESGYRRKEARIMLAIALPHASRGELQKAFDLNQSAILLLREIGDKESLSRALNQAGSLHYEVGNIEEALRHFKEALELSQRMHHPAREAGILRDIGNIYFTIGRHPDALRFFQRSARIARSLRDSKAEAYVLNYAGFVYESLGKNIKALDYYKRALALSPSLNHPRVLAFSSNNLGALYRRLGRLSDARPRLEAAISIARGDREDRAMETLALYNMTLLKRDQGRIDDALHDIRNIIQIADFQRSIITDPNLRTSYSASVYRHHELLIDLLMQKHTKKPDARYDVAAFEASEAGRARTLIEMLAANRVNHRNAVPEELLRKEREISNSLGETGAREITLREERHKLENSVPKQRTKSIELLAENTRSLESVRREIAELSAELDRINADITASDPDYRQVMQPREFSLSQLQEELDSETLILEFRLGEDRSHLWVIGRSTFRSYILPRRAEIEGQVRPFYRAASSPPRPQDNWNRLGRGRVEHKELTNVGNALSATLLKPVASLIGSKRLVIIPDGPLQYLSFGALPKPGTNNLLIDGHEVAYLPSLSVLSEIREKAAGRAQPSKTLAVIADPVLEDGDPRLKEEMQQGRTVPAERGPRPGSGSSVLDAARNPIDSLIGADESMNIVPLLFAAEEAEFLKGLLPESECVVKIGFDATRKAVMGDEVKQCRILHFATHGVLDLRNPKLSCLLLSRFDKSGNPQDGSLRLLDVYKMNLSADLVVLSACQTALGKDIRGEGLIGLSRGFMYAGASRVVSSLWNVDDVATHKLMGLFYSKMLGPDKMSAAAALRAAQLEMMRTDRWRHPYYWAGFVLQGDWK